MPFSAEFGDLPLTDGMFETLRLTPAPGTPVRPPDRRGHPALTEPPQQVDFIPSWPLRLRLEPDGGPFAYQEDGWRLPDHLAVRLVGLGIAPERLWSGANQRHTERRAFEGTLKTQLKRAMLQFRLALVGDVLDAHPHPGYITVRVGVRVGPTSDDAHPAIRPNDAANDRHNDPSLTLGLSLGLPFPSRIGTTLVPRSA